MRQKRRGVNVSRCIAEVSKERGEEEKMKTGGRGWRGWVNVGLGGGGRCA